MDQRSVRDILAGKTYFIRTFGCQMNQHDSERVSGLLDSYGCLMALDPEHADIVVFMTCCVREAADTRLYGQCNSCKSLPPSPSGKRVVAVGGCIAQRDGEGLLTNVDNVNVIFGTHSIAHMAELIAEAFLDGKRHIRTNEHEDTDAMSMPVASRDAVSRLGAHHDGLQQLLHVLHRALRPWSREESSLRGDCR